MIIGFKVKKEIDKDLEVLRGAYKEAVTERKTAEENFANADKCYIDVAIYQLNAATEKVSVLAKQIKKLENKENYQNEKLVV